MLSQELGEGTKRSKQKQVRTKGSQTVITTLVSFSLLQFNTGLLGATIITAYYPLVLLLQSNTISLMM